MQTSLGALTGEFATILENTGGCSKLINTLVLSNVAGADVSVDVRLVRGQDSFSILSSSLIPQGKSLVSFISKDWYVVLEPGDRLEGRCSSPQEAHFVCSHSVPEACPQSSSSSSSGYTLDCGCWRWNCETSQCDLVLVGCPESTDPCVERNDCCSTYLGHLGYMDECVYDGSCEGSSSSSSSSSLNESSSSSEGCLCSYNWNPSNCVDATVSTCYVDDGKLPSGARPTSLSLKVSKTIYLNGDLYEYEASSGSWKKGSESLTISGGKFHFTYEGVDFSIAPHVRYRELYQDYTLADGDCGLQCDCGNFNSGASRFIKAVGFPPESGINGVYMESLCSGGSGAPYDWGVPYTKVGSASGQGIYVSRYDGQWGIYNCPDGGTCNLGQLVAYANASYPNITDTPPSGGWFMNDMGPGGNPPATAGGSFQDYCISITYGSTCRTPNAASNCATCDTSPSVDYTTLPSYGGYFSGCTGRPIDIDVDACDSTVAPTSFTKSNFVLYYQGGSGKPFMVIDDVAYDPRGAGLIKVFEASSPQEMRDMVCSRLRFATLKDESKLATDIGSALESNWPYNDLYWYSACGNLPGEVPINLVPC